jgi:hypothetical protein
MKQPAQPKPITRISGVWHCAPCNFDITLDISIGLSHDVAGAITENLARLMLEPHLGPGHQLEKVSPQPGGVMKPSPTPLSEPTLLVRDPGHVTRCAGCGERIIWATTERGKPMPLNLAVSVTGQQVAGIVVLAKEVKNDIEWLRVPSSSTHWATCKKSKEFKGKGRA